MALLKFNCPATGREVDTGIELDAQSFATLPRAIYPVDLPTLRGSALLHTFKPMGELGPNPAVAHGNAPVHLPREGAGG